MNIKEKSITFRVNVGLFKFLREFAGNNKITVSEMVRNILVYFYMGYLMGDFKKTMPELQEEFLGYVNKKANYEIENEGIKEKKCNT